MGEVRLYALGIEELCRIPRAEPATAERLREIARQAFAPTVNAPQHGLISKLGPLFKRVPTAPVLSPTDPEPRDVEVLLAGAYVTPDRAGATWRVLEAMVQGLSWASTRLDLTPQALDELDFGLARGGVASAVGLRHLLTCTTGIGLVPVTGLTLGWHPYAKALDMAYAYREAVEEIPSTAQRGLVMALSAWLDGFPRWAQQAQAAGRPVPDLLGFWAH